MGASRFAMRVLVVLSVTDTLPRRLEADVTASKDGESRPGILARPVVSSPATFVRRAGLIGINMNITIVIGSSLW